MKVYIAHSRAYDYQTDLYHPIQQQINLPGVEFIFPHASTHNSQNSRDFYSRLDLIIAEVSYPATGLGIELGWAYDSHIPIACIYRSGCHTSRSLLAVTEQFYPYRNQAELINNIQHIIQESSHDH